MHVSISLLNLLYSLVLSDYLPPVKLNAVMRASAVGKVVASRCKDRKVGDAVSLIFPLRSARPHQDSGDCDRLTYPSYIDLAPLPLLFGSDNAPTVVLRLDSSSDPPTWITLPFSLHPTGRGYLRMARVSNSSFSLIKPTRY